MNEQDREAPAPKAGQPIFAMSYYFDVAVDIGLLESSATEGVVRPRDFSDAARRLCGLPANELMGQLSGVENDRALFICMDLCYISALLVEGFRIEPSAEINLAKKIIFNGEGVETQWTLGAAIEELSKL